MVRAVIVLAHDCCSGHALSQAGKAEAFTLALMAAATAHTLRRVQDSCHRDFSLRSA